MSIRQLLLASSLLLFSLMIVAQEVQVKGLFKGAAVLTINGQQQMLRVGKRSPEGVLLVSANPSEAVVELAGERHTLTLSRRISSNFTQADSTEVQISKNGRNQYVTNAFINGRQVLVMVDTGASAVAMNGDQARLLGIDYRVKGIEVPVSTAGGAVRAYQVILRSVAVGSLTVSGVEALVIDGAYPETLLLGMSYLQHVKLNERDGIMTLQQKY